MADNDPFILSVKGAARIERIIAPIERDKPTPQSGSNSGKPTGPLPAWWAKITDIGVGPDGTTKVYSWVEVRRQFAAPSLAWETVPSGRTGSIGDYPHSWAMSANGDSAPVGLIVWLIQSWDSAGTAFYTFVTKNSGVVVKIESSSGNGVYTGHIQVGTATGFSGPAITGFSNGAACIIYNGPELGTSPAYPYIVAGTATAPGLIIGVDEESSNPIVEISAVSLGTC